MSDFEENVSPESEATPAPARAGSRWGLLLLNLGTPDSPDPKDVRVYLREFLSDPRVLDINPALRKLILEAFILPRRPKESGEAYASIWTERGSPLLFHTLDLARRVSERLGDGVQVEVGMRYQSPSLESALESFRRAAIDRIVVFPLFPQYSSSAWGSGVEAVFRAAIKPWNVPAIQVVPPFFDHPAFIRSFVEVARPVIDELRPDRVILSFHGLPERHVTKSDESPGGPAHCLVRPDCCATICAANRQCYRAQCFATARGVVAGLGLEDDSWEVTFQSRLGKDPWIRPYTDIRIQELARSGTKRIAILSPAFVADCLETLEELAMRARDDFIEHGGEELRLVPSLNSEDVWVDAVLEILGDTTALKTR